VGSHSKRVRGGEKDKRVFVEIKGHRSLISMKRTISLMSAASAFEPGLEGEAVTEHRKRAVSAKAPVEPKQASTLTERPEVKIFELPHSPRRWLKVLTGLRDRWGQNWTRPKKLNDSEQESFHQPDEARWVNQKRNRLGFHLEQEEAPCAFTLCLSPRLPARPASQAPAPLPAFFPASPTPQDRIFGVCRSCTACLRSPR
jgi:hypothetical protein